MVNQSIKSQLKMKPVENKDIEAFNELLRYVFQISDDEIMSSGYEDDRDIIKAKRPLFARADVYGWFTSDDALISQVAIYPFEVNMHGNRIKMGGLTGVGTYPEYANLGLMSDLIKQALIAMRAKGQIVSYLYPYSVPFYRRKGWEIISDKMTFTLEDTQLPRNKDVQGHVVRFDVDAPEIYEFYDKFANQRHGAMYRDELAWGEYWRWENEEERYAALYYDEHNVATGLCFYWILDEIFHIKELIYLTQDAHHGLWNFISAHFSMINQVSGNNFTGEPIAFNLEDSDIVETIEPYYMGRIVDVYAFLKIYPFLDKSVSFTLNIHDDYAPWNDRIFGVYWRDGEIKIVEEIVGEVITMNIGTLSTLLFGYKTVTELAKLSQVQASESAVNILNKTIRVEKLYFSDYF